MTTRTWWALALPLALFACADDEKPGLTREQLLDPESCRTCHPTHYREWASSMHAYAVDDPVFQAMNRRGQEETNGELGEFCVDCHAPMAVREDALSDFSEVQDLPKHLKGVTCYFCHNAIDVGEPHNNDITLANDNVMRGGIRNPVRTTAHAAQHSALHDSQSRESSSLCGSCHDVVTPLGAHIERTFVEYQDSIFPRLPVGSGFESCQTCHMLGREGVIAQDPNAPVRTRLIHSHLFAAVDVALTEFPDRELQRLAVECELAGSVRMTLEPIPAEGLMTFRVVLETAAGHNQPSGAAQDRRMWLEFTAYDEAGNVLAADSSGIVEDGEPEDPDAWTLRDHIYDAAGNEVHMFWQAASHTSTGTLLPPTQAADDGLPVNHTRERTYQVASPALHRVTVRLRIRPMGFDVLQDLIDSKHLDPGILEQMPTFTIYGTEVEWTVGSPLTPLRGGKPPINCPDDYYCMLEPGSVYCED